MYVPRSHGSRPPWLTELLRDLGADTYKGDTDNKRVARHLCWQNICKALGGGKHFAASRFFVLASRRGGDISWLLGAGADRKNIIACDRNASAVKLCRARWPGVLIRHGQASQVFLGSEPKNFDAVMLDFCGPLGADTMRTIASVVSTMRIGSILGLGFMRGRERDSDLGILPATRARRRRAASMTRRGETVGRMSPGHLYGIDSDVGSWINDMNALLRGSVFQGNVLGGTLRAIHLLNTLAALSPRKTCLHDLCTFDYQSSTDESNGVPMTYMAFRKVRPGHVRSKNEKMGVVDTREHTLRECALLLEDSGEDAAMLLDIPRATVTAWKAHATRGTYARAAPVSNV